MRTVVATVAADRCGPDTADQLLAWSARTAQVEHLVVRDRADGGIDVVLYVQDCFDPLVAIAAVLRDVAPRPPTP